MDGAGRNDRDDVDRARPARPEGPAPPAARDDPGRCSDGEGPCDDGEPDEDDLAFWRGLAVAVVVGLVVWGLLYLTVSGRLPFPR